MITVLTAQSQAFTENFPHVHRAKKNVAKFGISSGSKTMREVVHGLSFSKQHSIGVALLKHCGVTF